MKLSISFLNEVFKHCLKELARIPEFQTDTKNIPLTPSTLRVVQLKVKLIIEQLVHGKRDIMEKIFKTLESLKVPTLSGLDSSFGGSINSAVAAAADTTKTKKKERINHCVSVTDTICSSTVQTSGDFTKILENATEVLFQLCNDPDPEIRLVATDCLHRIVRTVKDQYQHRFQMELYKEIKKNQNPRSLRVALSLFAFMSPLIRPQKCRVFMLSLLPCFSQISKRTEENLFEHIVPAFQDILKNLGPFINDNEVKMLCKDFIGNLGSSSAIIRRSSACILVYVCQYSRKPHVFLPKLLCQTVELLVPNLMEKSVPLIIGALLCIRHCIQPLYQQLRENFERKSPDQDNVVKNLIQVYEMCMILCNHDDHNVITTSLETLVQLLNTPVEQVIQRLVSPTGIQNSIDGDTWEAKAYESQISSSMCSLAFSDTANLLEGDSDLPNFRSLISSSTTEAREEYDVDMSAASSRRNSEVFVVDAARTESPFATEPEFGSSMEALPQSDEEHEEKTYSLGVLHFPEIQIGSLYETKVPLFYCARFLTYNFLLAGHKGHERPDSEVRISVKVLAINCLKNIFTFSPNIFSLPLPVEGSAEEDSSVQSIEDILLYLKHSDPLLRGSTYVLIGSLIESMLRSGNTYEKRIIEFIPLLIEGVQDSSNIGVKCAIAAFNECLVTLLRKDVARSFAFNIVDSLLSTVQNSYWLVKVDLVDLLSKVEWNTIAGLDLKQKDVLLLFLQLLKDEDLRVRTATTNALIRFIQGSTSFGVESPATLLCDGCVLEGIDSTAKSSCKCVLRGPSVMLQLELVLNELLGRLKDQDDKYAIAGYYFALASLSEKFPPRKYKMAWRCGSSNQVSSLLSICIESLRSSPIVYDTAIHRSLLSLATQLFLGSVSNELEDETENLDGSLFLLPDCNLSAHGIQLVQHCLAMIKLFQSLLEGSSSQSHSRKLSTSPVISPVKKFSQKLETEKKLSETEVGKKVKGHLAHNVCAAHFKKIGDVLSQSWKVYRSNLDPAVTTKFTSILVTALDSLGFIFAHIQPDYAGLAGLIDDVLGATYSVFHLSPIPTIQCIQKMLRCLFSRVDDAKKTEISAGTDEDSIENFRHFVQEYLRSLYTHRRTAAMKKPQEKSILGVYIRQFEPIVVNALRMYTTSSDARIQAEVLRLLSLLIKGHVNYGLVDKSQVFLGFVIKQIGFLEEGHIRNNGEMVEEMFEFLTLLSHEHQHSNRFIDIPKILRLCDGLVASGQNPLTHCIPALKKVVMDLFIHRSPSALTNLEKKELEAQREVVFQMLMKLSTIPQALPVLWVVIEGRRVLSEVKWNEDSMAVTAYLLPLIENGELQITNRAQFCGLMALLFCVSGAALPRVESIISSLTESIKLSKHTKAADFLQWQIFVTIHWLLLVRLHCSQEGFVSVESCSASFVLELLSSYLTTLSSILNTVSLGENQEFIMQLTRIFLQSVATMLRKSPELSEALKVESHSVAWRDVIKLVESLLVLEPALMSEISRLLCVLLHPDVSIWSSIMQDDTYSKSGVIRLLIHALSQNNEPLPSVEDWVVTNHGDEVIMNVHDPDVASLLNRASEDNVGVMIKKFLKDQKGVELKAIVVRKMLMLLERIHASHLELCGLTSVKLLERTKEPFLLFEISQLASFLYTKISAACIELSGEHKKELESFMADRNTSTRYPRLLAILRRLVQPASGLTVSSGTKSPVITWCCGEISGAEGAAVAKLLSNLSYSQIMNVFSQPGFNLGVIGHCFSYLKSMFVEGRLSSEDAVDLFTSEKRSCLIGRLSLGVAAFDFFVETLDSWERIIDEHTNKAEDVLKVPIAANIYQMWKSTEEVLSFKAIVIQRGVPRGRFSNNFITTKIFIFFFQFIRARALSGAESMENVEEFLSFASSVLNDCSFLKFFNAKEDPESLFVCIKTTGVLLKYIAQSYNLRISFTDSLCESWWVELSPEFSSVLMEVSHLVSFISQVDSGKFSVNPTLYKPFKELTAALGRCDVISSWVLVCHLEWKPPVVSTETAIPIVQNIPMDILQNERDLLLLYILKLNLFGAGSKVQFEENWMIFLSVMSSYGDENSQLQIVCTGLRALSMVLEKTVKVKYVPKRSTAEVNDVFKALASIDTSLRVLEPETSKRFFVPQLSSKLKKEFENIYEVDVNSCIRFLTDLFSQWLQNPQGKMPLLLLSEVVQCIVRIAEYFQDSSEFSWMFETLMEIFKSFEKEDEILWPHLIYGIFYSASKIPLEPEVEANLVQILDGALSSQCINVSSAAVESALVYLQSRPDSIPVLNVVCAFALKNTQLEETLNDTESRCCMVWKCLIFIWLYGPAEGTGVSSFGHETLSNILTALSPLNKVYVSIRVLVLKGLREKVLQKSLGQDAKRRIAKIAVDTLKSKSLSIFYETLRLLTAIFYIDFEQFCHSSSPDPEVLMQMAERTEIFFQLLKGSMRCNSLVASKVLPHIMLDFLPPSEILNRVIAEFMSPLQPNPELLAPVVAQLFEKARWKPKEAALVREWILSSVSNFLSNPNVSRICWSLTLFFIGVSTTPEVAQLLPFAELRRRSLYDRDLFIHSTMDFYSTLNEEEKQNFKSLIQKGPDHADEVNPYLFLFRYIEESERESS